eukprot:2405031-Prymnesium_polylepis.1
MNRIGHRERGVLPDRRSADRQSGTRLLARAHQTALRHVCMNGSFTYLRFPKMRTGEQGRQRRLRGSRGSQAAAWPPRGAAERKR